MLSLEAQTVYDILCAITGDNEVYKIVDAEEVIEKLPPAVPLTKIQLSQIIRDLKDREYVDVKYFTPDEYCLQIVRRVELPSAQQPVVQAKGGEDDKKERALYGEKKGKAPTAVGVKKGVVFLMAFLGGLAGSALVAAIAVVIIKFVL